MKVDEFHEIAHELEKYHGVFSKFWSLGRPIETDQIPTAAVSFGKEGNCVEFLVNPEFWNACSLYHKQFIICHECLHVLLNHGIRSVDIPADQRTIANLAMDISVNHMLVNSFGFDRELIPETKNYCWVDTMFTEEQQKDVKSDMHFEYYFNKLKTLNGGAGGSSLVDGHDFFNDIPEELQDQIQNAVDGFSEEEKEVLGNVLEAEEANMQGPEGNLPNGLQAGTMAGNIIKKLNVGKVKQKRKWETVIKRWASKYIRKGFKDREQWARLNRRFTMLDKHFFLPTEMEVDEKEKQKNRIKVWFFLDTSGSCAHLAERFFKAAMSLPEDKFDTELYCFDTSVYKVDKKTQELHGFGGTSFQCINNYIMGHCKTDRDHPKAVFIITDGYGDNVYPKFPKAWYWFLSVNYTGCIPKECNTFMLSDYE